MMNARSIPMAIAVMMLMIIALPSAEAGKAFLDDFEDGNFNDGSPVSWGPFVAPWDEGAIVAANGDMLLTPSPTAPSFPEEPNYINAFAVVQDEIYQDVSVHTQARMVGQGPGGHGLGIAVRETFTLGADYPGANVWAGYFVDVDLRKYITLGGWTGTTPVTTQLAPTSLDIHRTDVHLQLDVFGNTAKVFAWEDGKEKPTTPVLSSRLASGQMVEGNVHVWQNQLRPPLNELNTATFRFVEVVPEPSSALLAALGLLGLALSNRRVTK